MGNLSSNIKVSESDLLPSIYDYNIKALDGSLIPMSKFKNKVLIIFNSASKCGLTSKHIQQFNELHNKYNDKGLEILGFPTKQFLNQEYGDSCKIASFNKTQKIKYQIYEIIEVNGKSTNPLFLFLKFHCNKMRKKDGSLKNIEWNFGKFLVDKEGKIIDYFSPRINPIEMEGIISKLLLKD